MLQGDYAAARTVMQATADIRKLMGLDSPIQVEHGGSGVPIQHEMVSIELGDVTEALRVLAEVGAIRMAPDTPQLEGGVDGVYPAYSDS